MMFTPWVVRVVLGFRAEVWKTMQRPSVVYTAASKSSRTKNAVTRGALSE